MSTYKPFPVGTVRGPYNSTSNKLAKIYFMVQGPSGWRPVHGMQTDATFQEALKMALSFLLEDTSQKLPLITPQTITVEEDSPEKGLTKGREYKVRGDLISGLYIFNDHCLKKFLRDENGRVSAYCEYVNKRAQDEEL